MGSGWTTFLGLSDDTLKRRTSIHQTFVIPDYSLHWSKMANAYRKHGHRSSRTQSTSTHPQHSTHFRRRDHYNHLDAGEIPSILENGTQGFDRPSVYAESDYRSAGAPDVDSLGTDSFNTGVNMAYSSSPSAYPAGMISSNDARYYPVHSLASYSTNVSSAQPLDGFCEAAGSQMAGNDYRSCPPGSQSGKYWVTDPGYSQTANTNINLPSAELTLAPSDGHPSQTFTSSDGVSHRFPTTSVTAEETGYDTYDAAQPSSWSAMGMSDDNYHQHMSGPSDVPRQVWDTRNERSRTASTDSDYLWSTQANSGSVLDSFEQTHQDGTARQVVVEQTVFDEEKEGGRKDKRSKGGSRAKKPRRSEKSEARDVLDSLNNEPPWSPWSTRNPRTDNHDRRWAS
ncbi:hypothetical protein F4779DRAFT_222828 [Xylariaceae sp. FL0662B]|nr:hypothetical protein F4779DRAFT_222828 [Xylariaceae sp. FL0662B]